MDDGVLRGDGVFESILVRGGRTHAREAHLARMRTSARALDLRLPVLRQVFVDLLAAWGDHDGVLKVVVTRGGNVRGIVQSSTWPPTIAVTTVETPWRTPVSGCKTLSYAANMSLLRHAHAAHADDALVVDDGIVHELTTGAIAWVTDGVVRTPDHRALPILPSVTVAELAKVADVQFGVHHLDELLAADEIFALSATRPVLPVNAVDAHHVTAPGPVTEQLSRQFSEHVEATLDGTA